MNCAEEKENFLNQLKLHFSLYEESGQGCISKENAIKLFRISGFVLNFCDINFLNENFAEFLDFPEVLDLMKTKFKDNKKELIPELIRLFEFFDLNKNGFIEVITVVNLLKYGNDSFTDEEIKNIFSIFKPFEKEEKIFYKKKNFMTTFSK